MRRGHLLHTKPRTLHRGFGFIGKTLTPSRVPLEHQLASRVEAKSDGKALPNIGQTFLNAVNELDAKAASRGIKSPASCSNKLSADLPRLRSRVP